MKSSRLLRRWTITESRPKRRTAKYETGLKETAMHDTTHLTRTEETIFIPNKKQIVNRKTPKEAYAEVCTYQETDSNTVFIKKNYKVAVCLCLKAECIPPINGVFGTGARLHLLQEGLIKPD